MNALDIIMRRRTIRKFKSQPVSQENVAKIVECGQRAPSACSLQTYSIIWVKNEEKRKALWEACGRQQFILDAPITFVICADVRRIVSIMRSEGYETSLEEGFGYRIKLWAIIDATLAAENMVLAAEALGLGSVFIGPALANPKVIETVSTPKGVLPIYLLCVGHPDEDPPTRPRLPTETVLFIDQYREMEKDLIEKAVNVMNEKLSAEEFYTKYEKYPPKFNWTNNVQTKVTARKETEETITKRIKSTGFHPFEPIV